MELNRRKFIAALAGTGTTFLLNPSFAWAMDDLDPRVMKIVSKTLSIDTHSHIELPLIDKTEHYHYDFLSDFKKSGLSAVCLTFAVDYQKLPNVGDGYNRFLNGLDAIDALLKENNLKRALNLKELKAIHKQKRPVIIQSIEGGHFLEGHVDRLKIAYDRGLRVIGLLHDNDASVPLGDIYTNPVVFNGLTDFGKEVIKESNRLGIMLDLTHCSNKAIDDALKISSKPIVITHTSLDTQLGQNEKMAKMMMPRLISKNQAKIVADAGGVIGVWRHLTETPLEYAQNIRAMVDVVGVNHVCIGTDTKIAKATKPNEVTNNGRLGEYTNAIWQNQDKSFFYLVVDAMLKTGFNEEEIIKISGQNFCRVFDAATK